MAAGNGFFDRVNSMAISKVRLSCQIMTDAGQAHRPMHSRKGAVMRQAYKVMPAYRKAWRKPSKVTGQTDTVACAPIVNVIGPRQYMEQKVSDLDYRPSCKAIVRKKV